MVDWQTALVDAIQKLTKEVRQSREVLQELTNYTAPGQGRFPDVKYGTRDLRVVAETTRGDV